MLEDIKKTLWATADKLRANMDAAEYCSVLRNPGSAPALQPTIFDLDARYGAVRNAGRDSQDIGRCSFATVGGSYNLPERNLAVELLERLLEGEIKSRFAGNVVRNKKFSDMLTDVVQRYQNRSIEAAQVMEELVQMAKKFREAAARGEQLGLTEDEVRFYDALANNESAVRELTDETLEKIAQVPQRGLVVA